MGNRFVCAMIAAGAIAFSSTALGQSSSAQAIPRTADGKPDFSGVWLGASNTEVRARGLRTGQGGASRGERPFQPWARKMWEYHKDPFSEVGRNRNELNPRATHCFPPDLNYLITNDNDAVEIIQTPQRVMMVYEYDFWVRQAWMNEDHPDPEELELKWMGHSVGKWDGDTLVVDTIRIDPRNSYGNFIHTDALHLVERIRRVAPDMLEIIVTVDDPKAYTAEWTFGPTYYLLQPKGRLEERVFCNERFKDPGLWYGE